MTHAEATAAITVILAIGLAFYAVLDLADHIAGLVRRHREPRA